MKKAIIVLSVVAVIVSIFFTAISLSTAASDYANYTHSTSTEVSVSAEGYMKTRAGILIGKTAVTVIFCLYLALLTYKAKTILSDIIVSAVYFAFGPLLLSVLNTVLYHSMVALCTTTDLAAYNVYVSGLTGFLDVLRFAEVLIAFAVAFSIAEKSIRKKQTP